MIVPGHLLALTQTNAILALIILILLGGIGFWAWRVYMRHKRSIHLVDTEEGKILMSSTALRKAIRSTCMKSDGLHHTPRVDIKAEPSGVVLEIGLNLDEDEPLKEASKLVKKRIKKLFEEQFGSQQQLWIHIVVDQVNTNTSENGKDQYAQVQQQSDNASHENT